MSEYIPDKWLMVKINLPTNTYYKILGSWSGGYLYGDSWRLNSGVTRCEQAEYHYEFYGASGSCYSCHKQMYGANMTGWGVANELKERYNNEVAILSEEEAMQVIETNVW